jgi:hypothetical protein
MMDCFQALLFKFNSRRYSKAAWNVAKVGRCRLSVSKPESKPRLVSALEIKM